MFSINLTQLIYYLSEYLLPNLYIRFESNNQLFFLKWSRHHKTIDKKKDLEEGIDIWFLVDLSS